MTPEETKIADDLLAVIEQASTYQKLLPETVKKMRADEQAQGRGAAFSNRELMDDAGSRVYDALERYHQFLQACEARERLTAAAPKGMPIGTGTGAVTKILYQECPPPRPPENNRTDLPFTCRDCGRILPSTAQAMIREFGGTLSCGECTAAGKRILAK